MIAEQDTAGQVQFTVVSAVGDITVKLGGADTEHAYAEPAGASFNYRGRHYTGQIVLKRDSMIKAYGYGWQLKNERGGAASEAVHKAISAEVTAVILAALEIFPEILGAAEVAGLQLKLDQAHATTERLISELAGARHAEDELRAQLTEAKEESSS